MPQLEALNADITVLAADTDSERRKQEATSREVADLKDKLQQVLHGLLGLAIASGKQSLPRPFSRTLHQHRMHRSGSRTDQHCIAMSRLIQPCKQVG